MLWQGGVRQVLLVVVRVVEVAGLAAGVVVGGAGAVVAEATVGEMEG